MPVAYKWPSCPCSPDYLKEKATAGETEVCGESLSPDPPSLSAELPASRPGAALSFSSPAPYLT